jgi:DNA-binding CsgD family transcriptional regulator
VFVLRVVDNLNASKALAVSVAMLDRSGCIVAVNEVWKEFGRRTGLALPNSGVGANYLSYCAFGSLESLQLAQELGDLLAGKSKFLARIYPCPSPTEQRWFYMIGFPFSGSKQSGIALLHVNITPFFSVPVPAQGKPSGCPDDAKSEPILDLEAAARSIESSSLEALSSQMTSMLVAAQDLSSQQSRTHVQKSLGLAGLSKRQLEILGLLAKGKTNTEIADALSRSPNTVKLHVSAILRQLNVKSRTQAALLASKLFSGQIESSQPSSCEVA